MSRTSGLRAVVESERLNAVLAWVLVALLVAEFASEESVRVLSVDLDLYRPPRLGVRNDDLEVCHARIQTVADKKHVETERR